MSDDGKESRLELEGIKLRGLIVSSDEFEDEVEVL